MARTALVSLLTLSVPLAVGGFALAKPAPHRGAAITPTTVEIDAQVWQAVAASVVNGDIVAMTKTYHPAAVLVTNAGTKPMAEALKGWGADMVTAKAKGTKAKVELRFSKRQDDATTAFESGMFRYTSTDKAGKSTTGVTRFEALLVKTNGRWQTMMEHQMDPSTEAAWDQLPH